MLSIDAAREMAEEYLKSSSNEYVLYAEPIATGEFGWVFGYQSKKYLSTGKFSDALAGNAPVLIDKHQKTMHVLGTAHPIEFYVENYAEFGDPHKVASSKVELISRGQCVQIVEAIRCVRDRSNIGLAAAKNLVEACLSGHSPVVDCSTVSDATQLTTELSRIGFVVKQLGE